MALRIDDANLTNIARQIVDEASAAHPERTIELIASGDTDGKWDAARIGQLISNLVGNAVQHCVDGPILVEVQANSSHGIIAVTNRGVIPLGARPRLFEPFRRGDGDTPGLGLGLYIVRGIVNAHGGVIDLRCDDAANQTTFVAKLPRNAMAAT
jgi:sigma-B regulation protein RsbU (phosphoserine phosphatase)